MFNHFAAALFFIPLLLIPFLSSHPFAAALFFIPLLLIPFLSSHP